MYGISARSMISPNLRNPFKIKSLNNILSIQPLGDLNMIYQLIQLCLYLYLTLCSLISIWNLVICIQEGLNYFRLQSNQSIQISFLNTCTDLIIHKLTLYFTSKNHSLMKKHNLKDLCGFLSDFINATPQWPFYLLFDVLNYLIRAQVIIFIVHFWLNSFL